MATGIKKVKCITATGGKFQADEKTLQALAARWYKGESLKTLAAETGTSWPTLAGLFIARGWHKTKREKDAARKAAAKAKGGKGKKVTEAGA